MNHLQDMVVICKEEIAKLRKLEESGAGGGPTGVQQRGGINTAVADDVNAIFKGKTVSVYTDILVKVYKVCTHI